MLPYGRQSIDEEDIEAVAAVLRGDWLTTGPDGHGFEEELAALAGGHPCGQLHSARPPCTSRMPRLGVGPGDEVVTTPMTFVATAVVRRRSSAPRSSSPTSRRTPPTSTRRPSTPRSPTRPGSVAARRLRRPPGGLRRAPRGRRPGRRARPRRRRALGRRRRYTGRPVGSLADVTTFSFFPTKNLTTGEGGAVATRDPGSADRAHEFHFIGLVRDRDRLRYPDEGALAPGGPRVRPQLPAARRALRPRA